MKNKKILFILSSLTRVGPVNQLYELISSPFFCSGYSISILSLSALDIDNSRYQDFLPYSTVNSFNYNGYDFLKIRKKLKCYLNENKFDVIVSQGIRSDVVLSSIKVNVKKISIIHNYIYPDYVYLYGPVKAFFMSKAHIYSLIKMDAIISVSDSVCQYIKEEYGIKSVSIRNGVSMRGGGGAHSESKIDGKIEVIYIGALNKRKCFEKIARLWVGMPDQINLTVLGDGENYPSLKREFKRIDFLGFKNDVQNYLLASDVFISASLFEGLPLSVLEALSLGIPCILSDIEPHNEIISLSPFFGRIFNFDSSSVDELEEVIFECQSISKASVLEAFNNLLSSDIMAKKYKDFINNL